MQASNDAQIRELLLPFVHAEHISCGDTIYIQEFAIYGGANRADLAALNGLSHGYEIKSDKDTLSRLPDQVFAYNSIFERATLVAAERHLASAEKIIPSWWGIVRASYCDSVLSLERIKKCRENPAPYPIAIASLLWRTEALALLTSLGLDKGVRSKPMDCLVERLAVELPPSRLSRYVREALRARGDWKSAARSTRCDVKSRPTANQ